MKTTILFVVLFVAVSGCSKEPEEAKLSDEEEAALMKRPDCAIEGRPTIPHAAPAPESHAGAIWIPSNYACVDNEWKLIKGRFVANESFITANSDEPVTITDVTFRQGDRMVVRDGFKFVKNEDGSASVVSMLASAPGIISGNFRCGCRCVVKGACKGSGVNLCGVTTTGTSMFCTNEGCGGVCMLHVTINPKMSNFDRLLLNP